MRVTPVVLCALLLTTLAVVATPTLEAQPDLPPEYVGGYCGWHWHEEIDLEDGEYPHYHYHHCI